MYDASSAVSGRAAGRAVGVAAVSTKGTAGEISTFHSYEEALGVYTAKEAMGELIALLFQNGASQVKAAPVTDSQDAAVLLENYRGAFAALERAEELAAVICDSEAVEVQKALQESVTEASAARRERLAVVGGGLWPGRPTRRCLWEARSSRGWTAWTPLGATTRSTLWCWGVSPLWSRWGER